MLKFDFQDKTQIYQFIVGISGFVLILLGCMIILSPFFPALLLSVIFALSAWPAFDWLKAKLNNKTSLAAALTTLLLALCFIVPLIIIGTSASENFTKTFAAIQTSLQTGDMTQIAVYIEKIPLVGSHAAEYWLGMTADKEKLKLILQDYAGPTSQGLLELGKTLGYGLLDITIGVIIAYFFFRHGTHVALRVRNLIEKFGGERGEHLLAVTKSTLIGVVYGIMGTALIQGALAAFGFWLADVPGAPFLGLMTFFFSFIPMGPPLIWIPAALWLYSEGQMFWMIFVLLWGALVVGSIDNFLKPYFISKGSNLPFMLVLLGIGGGVLAFGFIGIFIGPTILALAYTIILELSTSQKLKAS